MWVYDIIITVNLAIRENVQGENLYEEIINSNCFYGTVCANVGKIIILQITVS